MLVSLTIRSGYKDIKRVSSSATACGYPLRTRFGNRDLEVVRTVFATAHFSDIAPLLQLFQSSAACKQKLRTMACIDQHQRQTTTIEGRTLHF